MLTKLFIKKVPASKSVAVQCCKCRKFKQKDGLYKNYRPEQIEAIEEIFLISHNLCESCLDEEMKKIES